MSGTSAAPRAASNARAEASRINGAKSRGPKTPEGKARSSQNALKHGLRAERFTVVGDEDEDVYDAHEQALLEELAPDGALQTLLAERIARAAWRLARADTIEAMLFDRLTGTDGDLGLAVIRDGNSTRAFETLLRYRTAAQAEVWRALRTLKALQAEAAQAQARAAAEARAPAPASAAAPSDRRAAREPAPNEPEFRRNPRESGQPDSQANLAAQGNDSSPAPRPLPQSSRPTAAGGAALRARPVPSDEPNEPTRRHPDAFLPAPGEPGPARSWQGAGAPHP